MKVRAFQVSREGEVGELRSLSRNDLPRHDVLIQVEWSGINYKDALGGLARGKIFKKFPVVAGIDLAGEVLESCSAEFSPGQKVLVHGCGLGESSDGGWAELASVPADWVVPLPTGMDTRTAMVFGTAGFTAALAVHRMLVMGQKPDMGPVVVTGASGGVGMFATALASHLGFEVWALSGKKDLKSLFNDLGAQRVITLEDLNLKGRPLESVQIGGAIDNLGGDTLAKLISCTQLWGNVASIGLAAEANFSSTVMPFILRGVSLLGISSANTPIELRRYIWKKLAAQWAAPQFKAIPVHEVTLENIVPTLEAILARQHIGRTVIKI